MTEPARINLFPPESKWVAPQSLPDLRGQQYVAVDIETRDKGLQDDLGPGWVWLSGHICGVAVAWGEDKQLYFPIRHPETPCFDSQSFKRWLRDLFKQEETRFIFHNAGYDLGWLTTEFDSGMPAKIEDTAAMAAIVDENRFSYALDALCKDYGLPGKDEQLLKEAISVYRLKDVKAEMWKLPAKYVGPYAEQDARATLNLYHVLKELILVDGTGRAYRLETELIPMIMEMRRRGIRVDTSRAEEAVELFARKRDEVLAEISRGIGGATTMESIRSPDWLVKSFDAEQIPYPTTAKGNPSFTADWMATSEHWLPKLITRAKKLEDASSKFFSNYILEFTKKGRVHPSIHQFRSEGGGTRSHRFSYSAPPLQQAPSRDGEFAPIFRGVFLPEAGEVWCALDYSQQEYRLIVHYAETMRLTRAADAGDSYRNNPNTDFHSLVAEMSGLTRKRAKDTNFAKAYGAGVGQFAIMAGMTEEEAAAVMKQYDERLPFVKELAYRCQEMAERNGYIIMIDGAKSHFDFWEARDRNIHGTPVSKSVARSKVSDKNDPWFQKVIRRAYCHKACNRLIQGSAARMTKIAMRNCWNEGLVPLLSVHDELDFSFTNKEDADRAQQIMIDAVKLTVPVKVDAEFGVSWGDSMKGHSWEEAQK